MLVKWAGGKTWLTKNHPYVFHNKESLKNEDTNPKSIEFNRYIDPFLGGGAVFRYLEPSKSILSDVNEELIAFYKCLKLVPEELYNEVKSYFNNHSKEYYYYTRSTLEKKELKIAARFLYLNYTCYNGIYRVNKSNLFNVPIGDRSVYHYRLEDFVSKSNLLQQSDIKTQDFRKTISEAKQNDLLYIDPPYVTKNNKTFNKYSPKVFSWKDQVDLSMLLQLKHDEGVNIIISNINDSEIRDLYSLSKGWKHKPINRANILTYKPTGKKYKEIVISNI